MSVVEDIVLIAQINLDSERNVVFTAHKGLLKQIYADYRGFRSPGLYLWMSGSNTLKEFSATETSENHSTTTQRNIPDKCIII
jgi:hypothetical protein